MVREFHSGVGGEDAKHVKLHVCAVFSPGGSVTLCIGHCGTVTAVQSLLNDTCTKLKEGQEGRFVR